MQEKTTRGAKMRSALAVLGAATLLVGGIQLVATAATGGPLLLGKSNVANKTTKLKTTGNKEALSLKSKSGKAPLKVSNSTLIKKLNADLVDGKSIDEIEPTTHTFSIGTAGAPGAGTAQFFQTTSLPSGNYRVSFSGLVGAGAGDSNTCLILDGTRFINSGGTDFSAIFAGDSSDADGGTASLTGSLVAPIVTGNRLIFVCQFDTGTTVIQPVQFTVQKIDRTAAVPGVGPTTFPRGTGGRLPLR